MVSPIDPNGIRGTLLLCGGAGDATVRRTFEREEGAQWHEGKTVAEWREYLSRIRVRSGYVWAGDVAFSQAIIEAGWLPDVVWGGKPRPKQVGLVLTEATAVLVQGRTLTQRGDGSPTFAFASGASLSARVADLTTLRRIARDRTLPLFPPKKLGKPEVKNGTLVIVGGGGMPRGLAERFVELAGGKNAVIATIPISLPDPLPERDAIAEAFRRAGAKEVSSLTGRTPAEVDVPETLNLLKRATGVWFGGGRQWRFVDAYEGTQAEKLLHDVLKRGGVIGGSSAGASIQGEYLARGNPLGPQEIIAPGYERGMGFLRGMAIDQHFSQRNRFRDMEFLMRTYPQLLGVGIDEATAIVVQKSSAEVVGRGKAHFYAGKPEFTALSEGERYDLARRKVAQ